MTAPPHTKEHHELLQLLAKATENSKLVDRVILVTIGYDGRPCVGGSIGDPDFMMEVLGRLGRAPYAEDSVKEIEIPGKGN